MADEPQNRQHIYQLTAELSTELGEWLHLLETVSGRQDWMYSPRHQSLLRSLVDQIHGGSAGEGVAAANRTGVTRL